MIFWSIFKMALNALWVNKLRTTLTLIGVIIGVTSVITIVSALEGMTKSITDEIDRLGPTTFTISRMGFIRSEKEFFEALKRKKLKYEYVEAIREGCQTCEDVAVRVFTHGDAKYKNEKLRNVWIAGTSSNFVEIVEYEVAYGRFHSEEDDFARRRVAFIGQTVKNELYPNVDPIGKDIKIRGIKYTIIGVAKEQGAMFGNDQDRLIIVPYSSFARDFVHRRHGDITILVKAKSLDLLEYAMDEVRVVLRAYRHVPYDEPDDFSMMTADTFKEALNDVTKYLRFGLIGITSISLVVGGIIIMNIMMVSVTERTREIGIRKSIGARRKDILLQFLFEALVLSLGGGIIGITIGVVLGDVLINLIDMDMSPSLFAIILGLIISGGVGLFFGIYPAMKASRLQPVKALSFE